MRRLTLGLLGPLLPRIGGQENAVFSPDHPAARAILLYFITDTLANGGLGIDRSTGVAITSI